MRKLTAVFSLMFVLSACGEPVREGDNGEPDAGHPADAGEEVTSEFCEGTTAWLWDPPSKDLLAFPDDYFTTDDAASPTGVQVDFRPGDNVNVPGAVSRFKGVYSDIDRLDGFGVNGATYLRFTGPLNRASLPSGGLGSGTADSPILLVSLEGETATLLDYSVSLVKESGTDDSTTLVVKPLVPLAPASRYAVVVTNALKDAANGCVAPSPTFISVVDDTATEPGLTRLAQRYQDVVARLVTAEILDSVHDVSAAVVFTTQSIVDESVAIAQDIRARTIPFTFGSCTVDTDFTHCEGTLSVGDYRTNGHYIEPGAPTPTAVTLPVSIWMPNGEGPFPTVLYAHGLGGDRLQAGYLAPGLAPTGFAVMGIDAPKHGSHYDQPASAQTAPLELFGVDSNIFSTDLMDTRQLADNFRQAAYDKLQVVQALTAGIDADDDGNVDLNADELVFAGASLGGIMGPELLALAPEFDAAVALVPGARLADIVADSSSFAQGRQFALGSATDGELARLFAVFQASVDRADPGSWGPHVLGDRLTGFDTGKPQFLMQMVIDDGVVPNSANAYYARSLGLELAGDELLALDVEPMPALPASGNLETGLTGGVYQLDVDENGNAFAHNTGPFSSVSSDQVFRFIGSYFLTGEADIVDSYRTLGIK